MDYTVQELIHNQSFRRMVKGEAEPDEVSQWNRWIEAGDENRRKTKQATAEIVGFEFKDPDFPDVTLEWKRLKKTTFAKKHVKPPLSHYRSDALKWTYRAAAIFLLFALIGIGVYFYFEPGKALISVKQITQSKTIKTGSNEQRTIAFSNGSKIVLNSHSTLTYQLGMFHNQTIKIKLQGEAYFEAVKNKAEFAVYTPDGIIQDVGTKFLVTVQKKRTQVVLQAGKVEINMKGNSGDRHKFTMKKGEMISFDRSHILTKKKVNPSYYTSWATGFMQFHHTSLQKFAGFVEKKFNIEVKIVDPKLDSIKLSGSIYFKTLTGLLRSVSKVAMISTHQSKNGKIVYLGSKHYGKVNFHE